MGTTDDPSNFRDTFAEELSRLHDLPVTQDSRAIRTWANKLTGEPSTKANLVCNARTLSRRAHAGDLPPLTEMRDETEFYVLHDSIRDGSNPDVRDTGLATSTLRNIRKAARLFFRDGLGVAWAEDIHIGEAEQTSVTEDDIYTAEDTEALFDACRNPRDKALIGTLLATGQRISALLSLRVRDVDLEDATGFIYLNDDAVGLKGAAGKRPLLWATEYVKNWLDVHPRVRDGDAALFCMLQTQSSAGGDGASGDTERDIADPLTPWGVNQQLRRIGTRADLEKPVNPHNFRHSAVTRMVREGVPEQQIKWTVGWDPDSTQFDRYSHLQDDEHVAAILDHYDIEHDDHGIGAPTLDSCPACGTQLSAWVNPKACPGCGCSLTNDAAAIVDAAEEMHADATDTGMASTDPNTNEVSQAVHMMTEDPQAFMDRFMDVMGDDDA